MVTIEADGDGSEVALPRSLLLLREHKVVRGHALQHPCGEGAGQHRAVPGRPNRGTGDVAAHRWGWGGWTQRQL